jgi:hypothetical protein
MEIQSVAIRVPNKGDVVWAIRLPMHCGIYEGNNSIIHFAPLDSSKTKGDAIIHRSTLEEFSNGSPYIVIEFPPEKCLPPEESIQRACSRLGEKTYNLFLNNCDHFATWCKIGEHRSLQIDLIKKIAVAMCEFIDKSNEKQTEYEKTAEIICKMYEIAEVLLSTEKKKTRPLVETTV